MKRLMYALLPLLATPLMAQQPSLDFEGNLGVVQAFGDLKDNMADKDNIAGYTFGVAARFQSRPGLGHRVFINALAIRGKEGTGMDTYSPKHLNAGYDICLDTTENLTVFGGLGIVKWSQDTASITLPDFSDENDLNNRGKGTKVAGRIGLEYKLGKGFAGQVAYTQTEFNKKFNPSWFTVGVSYRFGGIKF
ncbi:MAG: hypothetical protein BWY56_01406 [Acidobacteria bacterium ADurb.Bin340]|nr:MAG: hypothetical protein BWY56_01406 [Acidobacteria bacterium ADurb.Bin340]